MFFENRGVGKCLLLKELNPNYSLVYACNRKEFIVATDLNKETGSWSMGSYFDDDLDQALAYLNQKNEEIKREEQER